MECLTVFNFTKMPTQNNDAAGLGKFLLGAALGVAAGLLLAPYAGEESRKKLAQQANALKDEWAGQLNQLADKVQQYVRKGEQWLEQSKGKTDEGPFQETDGGLS
jgi:gas vesicle protein